MTKRHFSAILLIFLFFLLSCGRQVEETIQVFNNRSASIQERFIPDKSLAVLNVQLTRQDDVWLLNGETSDSAAYKAVLQLGDSLLGKDNYVKAFVLMPYTYLGDSTYGIINRSVAHLRREPRHAAELVDQAIMGDVVRLLKKEKSWYLIQTSYGYLGWMTKYSMVRCDKAAVSEWINSSRVRVTSIAPFIYQQKNNQSFPVSDAVLNMTLKQLKKDRKWTKVELPDGRIGYIANSDIGPLASNNPLKREDIIYTAKRMTGVPYLWGGNSSKASDCSGFTHTVFLAHGLTLPRDARQQALIGKEIKPEADFSNILPGDLLFFGSGESITHVGISLGGPGFIHQDRDVNIDSFDEKVDNYNGFRKKTLKLIRRIIQ